MALTFATTDICDAHEKRIASGALRVLAPGYLSVGSARFCGPTRTLKIFEDNTLVRSLLETAGAGQVLVVDAGGSLRCAVVGGNLAALAEANGWAGIVVYGAIRDLDEIDACNIGVRALAAHPRRSDKRGTGEADVTITFSGVRIAPGEWIYSDRDGIVVSDMDVRTA